MQLVGDAGSLVGAVLGEPGRRLIADASADVFVAERAWVGARRELRRRARFFAERRGLEPVELLQLLDVAVRAVEQHVSVIGDAAYGAFEAEARRRVVHIPEAWPSVALALALRADIWTTDDALSSCGVPTWSTAALSTHLAQP